MISSTLAPAIAAEEIKPQLAKLRSATDELQANFVKNLISEMRKEANNDFKDVPGSDIYDDMINQTLANKISKQSNLGISDLLYNQLSKRAISQQMGDMIKQSASKQEPNKPPTQPVGDNK